jgi:hypothetical protein
MIKSTKPRPAKTLTHNAISFWSGQSKAVGGRTTCGMDYVKA